MDAALARRLKAYRWCRAWLAVFERYNQGLGTWQGECDARLAKALEKARKALRRQEGDTAA